MLNFQGNAGANKSPTLSDTPTLGANFVCNLNNFELSKIVMSETTTIYQQHKSFPNQFFVEVLVVWVMNKMCFHQPRRLMFVLP